MYKIRVAEFFKWISGGTSAAALGLFVFTVGLPTDQWQKSLALAFFSFSIPILVGATAISKDVVLHKKISERSDLLHSIMLTLGVLSFMGALGLLWYLINAWLLPVFGISFCIAVLLYSYSYNSLIPDQEEPMP